MENKVVVSLSRLESKTTALKSHILERKNQINLYFCLVKSLRKSNGAASGSSLSFLFLDGLGNASVKGRAFS